jgi:hypothetical protein
MVCPVVALPNPNAAAIIQLIRDLSTFDAIGRTASSATLKAYNRCVSKKAYDWMNRCSSFEEWNEATVNEHSTLVKIMLQWVVDRLPAITDNEIEAIFHDNPVCTVLIEPEDNLLKRLGYRSSGVRTERYAAAGIDMIYLSEDPTQRRWR